MFKKYFSFLLLVGSIFFLCSNSVKADCFYTNNNNVCMTEEEYNNLLSLDFDEFDIENMLEDIFNDNKNLTGQVVSETTNYYVDTYTYEFGKVVSTSSRIVSEEEYNYFVSVKNPYSSFDGNLRTSYDGYTETSAKKMRTTITAIGTRYRFKNKLEWKTMPVVRSYDIIGIGYEYEKVYTNNRIFSQTFCVTSSVCTSSSTSTIRDTSQGVGATYLLPTGTFVKMTATLYYDVYKKSGVGTVSSLDAVGDYSHAIESVSQSDATYGYLVNLTGNWLYNYIYNSYDEIPEAQAYWTGSW